MSPDIDHPLEKPYISLKIDQNLEVRSKPAWPHQEMAWTRMKETFPDSPSKKAGVVVVPTGGGKTWLASSWLLQNHIANGGRLLWLTHRTSLLRQAFKTFMENAFLAKPLRNLNMIRISSDGAKWSQVTAEDQIVFSTVQSASGTSSRDHVILRHAESPLGLFVVVDEAHHACSASYLRIIADLKKRGIRLLGLTATPFRMDKDDQRRLWDVFDHNLIYQISMAELINKKILSQPVPETVNTHVEMEREFTEKDYQYLEQFGELAPRVLGSLAKNASRNSLIVQYYQTKAHVFGKTIIFAVDVLHAKTLAEEFQRNEVECDYVAYCRDNSEAVMAAFREKPTPVIITNVEMLTEGFDAPKTQTVFIVRPTRSETLVRQMIGRALRGPEAGGNEYAYLVTFVDTWKDYHPLDAEIVVDAELAQPPLELNQETKILIPIPPELVREAYSLVMSVAKGHIESFYECLPHSWYSWEEENDDQIGFYRRYVLVFENQVEGFQQLEREIINRKSWPAMIDDPYAEKVIRDYFSDTTDPVPSVYDIVSLLSAYRDGKQVSRYTLDEKTNVDPTRVAKDLCGSNTSMGEIRGKIEKFYEDQEHSLCKVFYPGEHGKQDFFTDVWKALEKIVSPPPPPPPPVSEPPDPQQLRKWPEKATGYRLNEIWDAVTSKNFPQGPPKVSDIRYAREYLKRCWAFFRHTDSRIVVSPIINSPDVPRFVVEFLVYHEMLHAYLPYSNHNKDFRSKERAFIPSDLAKEQATHLGMAAENIIPNYWQAQSDRWLDSFGRKYKLEGESEKWW